MGLACLFTEDGSRWARRCERTFGRSRWCWRTVHRWSQTAGEQIGHTLTSLNWLASKPIPSCLISWSTRLTLRTPIYYLPQLYSNLFFLLQSEPRHIASLCRLVSLSEIDTLLQTVMFTLYGNQYESREEHLLLTMFQVCYNFSAHGVGKSPITVKLTDHGFFVCPLECCSLSYQHNSKQQLISVHYYVPTRLYHGWWRLIQDEDQDNHIWNQY